MRAQKGSRRVPEGVLGGLGKRWYFQIFQNRSQICVKVGKGEFASEMLWCKIVKNRWEFAYNLAIADFQ